MTVFARESDRHDCPDFLPFCGSASLGPGPAINAASAPGSMQDIPITDPTLRDPNAALNKYDHRMAPAMIIGGVVVFLLVAFGCGLLITLDKGLRKKLAGWMSCGRRKEADGTKSPASDRSDITRVNTPVDDVERGMRMSFNAPSVRGMPSPLRQESTQEGKSEDGAEPGVPVLHSRS